MGVQPIGTEGRGGRAVSGEEADALASELACAPRPCPETVELLGAMADDVQRIEVLDSLVRALVRHGLWDTLGRVTWVRDAADGVLLRWEPAALPG